MKVLGILIGLIVLVVAAVFGYLFFFAGDVVERGIEEIGPQYLGTSVEVGKVDMDFVAGRGGVSNLTVGNPAGFEGDYAMRLGEISTALDLENSSAELIVIKDITVRGASIAAIAKGQKTNLQQLMDNIEQAVGSTGSSDSADTSTSPEVKFIVDRFNFSDANVSLSSDLLGDKNLEIPDISLSDVGRKGNGATAAELAEQLLAPITKAVSRAVVSEGLDLEGVEDKLKDKLREKLPGADRLKDLF